MALSASLAIDIVSQEALKAFNAKIQPLMSFSTDFSADAVKIGSKIQFTWTPAGATVTDYNPSNGYVTEEPTQLPKELAIDKNKYVGFHYTDDQLATLTLMKLEEIGAQYGAALAEAVLSDIWSLVTSSNFSNVGHTGLVADFDSDDILDIGKAADNKNWPDAGRNLILNTDYYTQLCKDDSVKDASAAGGAEAIREGKVPGLGTFANIYKSTKVPDNSENLTGFAVNTEAIGIAFRSVTPDSSAAKVMEHRTYTNESGMTICFKEWYDPDKKTTKRVMEVYYGKCVGNPDALLRIRSADPEA